MAVASPSTFLYLGTSVEYLSTTIFNNESARETIATKKDALKPEIDPSTENRFSNAAIQECHLREHTCTFRQYLGVQYCVQRLPREKPTTVSFLQ